MNDTLVRQWQMLQLLPRQPRRCTAQDLASQLRDRGWDVTERTVQRDLQSLASVFRDIGILDNNRPYQWFWKKDTILNLPAMDITTALALRLAEEHLSEILPEAVRRGLSNQFEQARQVLSQAQQLATSWPSKVRVEQAGLRLQDPPLDHEILDAVQTALFAERQLQVDYKRADGERKAYTLHPLGLVWRGPVGYLIAHYGPDQVLRQFALHRMQQVVALAEPRVPLTGFDLQSWVDEGAMQVRVGEDNLRLRLHLDERLASRLRETAIAPDQCVRPLSADRYELTATVADTQQLRSFLRSYGEFVEVMEPASLRAEFAAEARRLAQRYAAAPANGAVASA